MTIRPAYSVRPAARRTAASMAGLLLVSAAAAGCSSGSADADGAGGRPAAAGLPRVPAEPAAKISSNLPGGEKAVPVDKVITLSAADGTFHEVQVTAGQDRALKGELSKGKTSWTSTGRLQPGRSYRISAVAVNEDGKRTVEQSRFRTENLTLDEQTYPSIAPLRGETVGVGMPVIVKFDVPVTNRASIERHLSVESTPAQSGAWHWISDYEVHWRPEHYWKAGSDVTVHANIDSVPAGNGIYGQLSRSTTFHIGDSVISKVHIKSHRMKVFINGKLRRTIPVSAGMPGFITRSGTKVVIEKVRHKRMDAATIGIGKNSPNYYNLSDVEYAMRVTYSGEFVHAAPWSVGYQGSANVSHGCVGMSTANAAWLYNLTHRGDIVDVSGSARHMTLTNGYGDWTESFAQYKKGSALD